MDTRKVSPEMRRRVGEPVCVYSRTTKDGVVKAVPMGTDWPAIEAVFAAKPGVAHVHRGRAGLSPVVPVED